MRYMQSVNIQTAQNVNIRYEAASVGDRIVAFLIDAIIRVLYGIGIGEVHVFELDRPLDFGKFVNLVLDCRFFLQEFIDPFL